MYGGLGVLGFFVIYWTFAETEGRRLEDIEEFYKTGIRGIIPKRASTEGTSRGLPINFTHSMNSVTAKNENKETSDKDMTVNKPDTIYSNAISGGVFGESRETLQTTLTASVASLQDRESTIGGVTEMNVDREKKLEEAEMGKEKYDKTKIAEKEKPRKSVDVEGTSSESKEITENNFDTERDRSTKEKVVVHNEAGVEERTSMS